MKNMPYKNSLGPQMLFNKPGKNIFRQRQKETQNA